MKETVYDIFAKKARGDALRHIGYIDAFDDDLAKVYAWNTYNEENWFEMRVVRRSALMPVNLPTGAGRGGSA